ncbi:hypothetical protein [Microbacterium rhizophilus]|uniref:hypothetical protein n=1 Tax=Microbacterium rhizophilus TaxID=3138934 RepID=UPI0031EC787B
MTFSPRAGFPRAIAYSAVAVIAPWVALVVPNLPQLPWMYEPAALVLPAVGAALAIGLIAVVVRARRRRAVPTLLVGTLAAICMLLPALAALAVMLGVPATGAALGSRASLVVVATALTAMAASIVLMPAWMAAARFASPLIEPRAIVRRTRLGSSVILVAGVAAISLGIWIAGGTATSDVERIQGWGGLTYALAWGMLGISLVSMGRPAEVAAGGPRPADVLPAR